MLYIVGTPIGNLGDITLRALEVLRKVDLILCEDTRVTKKLLDRFEIKKLTLSYHQHSKLTKLEKIVEMLKDGKSLAMVSDAGTPGISDPGGILVKYITEKLPDVKIIPIPGVSAVATLLSVSGFSADKFIFLGFPPHKKGRNKFWQEVSGYRHTVVFYESKHRIIKSLKELREVVENRDVVVGRELTKMYETIYRGELNDIIKELEDSVPRGEYVVIVNKK